MILVFSGREHHKTKLQPVFDALAADGQDVRWLVCNNAVNIDPPLLYMNPSGQTFVHAYQQLRAGDKEKIDRIVTQALADLPYLPGVPPYWHVYSVREAAELLVSFDHCVEKASAVLILHSNNFFTKILAYLAQKRGVPVFAFQEGILRERDQETMNKQQTAMEYVDLMFCWSQGAKRSYIKSGLEAARLVVTGPSHLDKYVKMSREEAAALTKHPATTVLFVPTIQDEYIGNISQDARYLHNVATSLGYNFIFRPHPFEAESYGDLPYALNTFKAPDNLTLCRNANTVIVGQHSTIMTEAVALGGLVVEYQENGEEILQPLAPHMALSATRESLPTILRTIEEQLRTLDEKKVRKFVREEFGDNLGSATGAILKEIKRVLQ